MIIKENKNLYNKLSDFFDMVSEISQVKRERIIKIFKIGCNDVENIRTDKVIKGLYYLAAKLPQYNVNILTSDLMMYYFDKR
jgi:hypothetical protein